MPCDGYNGLLPSGINSNETQAAPLDPDLLPILGEALAVELANTLYQHRGETTMDFLATSEHVALWFAHAPPAASLGLPKRLTSSQVADIRALRNAVHHILDRWTRDTSEASGAPVATLNRYASRTACRLHLDWPDGGTPRAALVPSGPAFDALLARLACDCIGFLAGPQLPLLRRCDGPDCAMFFVQHHHKRRFCQEGCSHRARQARYYHATAPGKRTDAPARPAAMTAMTARTPRTPRTARTARTQP